MVVTIDSKFYSKLQLGISKYQEKTPADPLKLIKIKKSNKHNAKLRVTAPSTNIPKSMFL